MKIFFHDLSLLCFFQSPASCLRWGYKGLTQRVSIIWGWKTFFLREVYFLLFIATAFSMLLSHPYISIGDISHLTKFLYAFIYSSRKFFSLMHLLHSVFKENKVCRHGHTDVVMGNMIHGPEFPKSLVSDSDHLVIRLRFPLHSISKFQHGWSQTCRLGIRLKYLNFLV